MSKHEGDYKTATSLQIDWCTCCETGVHIHLLDRHGRIFACACPEDIDDVVRAINEARVTRAEAVASGIETTSGKLQ